MSRFIKFYFTSSMLNMFRTLIHPSSGACDFSIVSPHWLCVLVSMCVVVSVWLVWGGIRVAGWSLINCDIKLVSYSSTIIMMHGPIYIILTKYLSQENQSPSWESNSFTTSEEIFHIIWKLKILHWLQRNLSQNLNQSQKNLFHLLPFYL